MTLSHDAFPNSISDPFIITSPQTTHYNCIAWAFGDDTKWYWPNNNNYWPLEIPNEEKIENFMLLFKSIGYEVCSDGELEQDYLKIAIYESKEGKPTHAARQLANGMWTSKLGQNYDVTHTLFAMENGAYGNAKVFMKKIRLN